MAMFDVFVLVFLALWVFEGLRNIGKLIGEGVLPQNDTDLTKLEMLGVACVAFFGGPIFSGWYPAFRDKPKKPSPSACQANGC